MDDDGNVDVNQRPFLAGISPAFLFVWASIAIALTFALCMSNRRFWRVCWRRICRLQWDVPTDDIDEQERQRAHNHVFDTSFVPRYPPGDPRHVITKEQAEQMKKDYISRRLEGFTKVCISIGVSTKFCFELIDNFHDNEVNNWCYLGCRNKNLCIHFSLP